MTVQASALVHGKKLRRTHRCTAATPTLSRVSSTKHAPSRKTRGFPRNLCLDLLLFVGGMSHHRARVYAPLPRRQPLEIAVSTPPPKSFEAVIYLQKSAQKVRKSASQAVLSRMKLTFHATRRTPTHGASRLVQAMPAWSVKTRRAPTRHCGDARV